MVTAVTQVSNWQFAWDRVTKGGICKLSTIAASRMVLDRSVGSAVTIAPTATFLWSPSMDLAFPDRRKPAPAFAAFRDWEAASGRLACSQLVLTVSHPSER